MAPLVIIRTNHRHFENPVYEPAPAARPWDGQTIMEFARSVQFKFSGQRL